MIHIIIAKHSNNFVWNFERKLFRQETVKASSFYDATLTIPISISENEKKYT